MTMHASSSILNPPAHTERRSVLRQFIDAVIEGRRRKAQHELALYLEHHKHSLKDDVRIELKNRLRASVALMALVTAIGRSLPALICSIVRDVEPNRTCTCPPSRSVITGPPPRYGT